jgi:hypothetical protein
VFWISLLRVWSDQSEFMALFVGLICGLVQFLFLSHVVNFLFFSSDFPVTAHGLNPFSGAYHKKLQFLRCSMIRIAQSEGSTGCVRLAYVVVCSPFWIS